MHELQTIYDTYVRQLEKVIKDAPALAGLWGWGDDPKKDPCHTAFYEAVEQYLTRFLASEPTAEEAFPVVRFVLCTPVEYKDQEAYWYMYAAQGLCGGLVDRLSGAQCAQLRDFYDENYPRRDRMPVQEKLYKQLKKAAGKR